MAISHEVTEDEMKEDLEARSHKAQNVTRMMGRKEPLSMVLVDVSNEYFLGQGLL